MARRYTKVEGLAEEVQRRKEAGETYREIGASYGLTLQQVKNLMKRQRRKARLVAAGYVLRPKGRPTKSRSAETEAEHLHNENVKLKMTVEVLRNFLLEAGRR